MSDVVIKIENLSKQYRLGLVSTGTIAHDLNRFWCKLRGKDDPYLKIGESNDRSKKGESDYVWALKDINLEVKRGERIGIIGKNGAGKSTLLKILSQVTGPTTGRVKMKGRVGSLLEVGTGFHPELTGRENIYMNGTILGMKRWEVTKKLDEIVDFAGVERYLDTPVKRYSSGMTVRLGFAVAAHLEPDILIVDEVLAVGDAEFQKKAIGKMQEVSEGHGRTILFVSHNMGAIKSLCESTIVINNGGIAFNSDSYHAIIYYRSIIPNNSLNSKTSINDPKVRRGSGDVRFSSIKMMDSNFKTKNMFFIEEDICFELSWIIEKDVDELFLSISFRSGNTGELITSTKRFNIFSICEKIPKTRKVVIRIKKHRLRVGIYNIYFWLGRIKPFNKAYDVVDGLAEPLEISTKKSLEELSYDPLNPTGYFDIESELVEME